MKLKTPCRIPSVRSFLLAMASFSALALQAASTSYINSSGVSDTADCTAITSSTTTLETGWYVAEGTVTISSTVTVNGNVNLILADGAKLTVSSTVMDKPGICVEVVGSTTNSLSIYCQDEGSGELHSSSSSYGPGIGTGGEDHTCGIVTIYGGVVYATGSSYGSGIGSGWKGSGGSVTINGGTVTAIGGTSAGAGIGGGYQSVGGTVIINGGTVVAKAQNDSYAGIGGQSDKDQGSLTVGGNVVVKAGNSESLGDSDIRNPNGETSISLATIYKYYQVELTGPKPLTQVTSALAAYAGEAFNIPLAPTISGGSGPYAFSGTVPEGAVLNNGVLTGTLSAGVYNFTLTVTDSEDAVLTPPASYTLTVTARPKSITYKDGTTTILGLEPAEYTPGTPVNLASYVKPGYTFLGWYDNDGLAGDAVTAVSATDTEDLTFWASCSLDTYTIQYYNGSTPLSLAPTSYTITQTPVSLPTPEGEDGYTFAGWCTTMGCTDPPVTSIAANATGDKVFYAKWTSNTPGPSGDGFIPDDPEEPSPAWNVVAVDCQTPDGVFQRNCKQLADYMSTLNDSWYYVSGEVTIESLTIEGKVSLILCDGATLTVGGMFSPGIQLTPGNTLTIYGQSGGTGALIATGGSSCAGIGANSMENAHACGKLNVYGGSITATGGDWASGIGGVDLEDDSLGGQIFVYGGTVTAVSTSDNYGGIGSYKYRDQGSLTVGANMIVTAGADADSAVALTPDANGVVTLSAQKYFHIESTGSVPLAQGRSELAATVGDVITLSNTIVGGKKPYTFTGSVPSGLTLSDGTLTCTAAGSYNFTLTVTDADSTVIQATYAITVEKKEKSITYIDGTDGVTVLTGLTPDEYTPGGSTVYLPDSAAVTKTGYTFNGWYLTPELEQGGSTVYAIYSWDSYTSDMTFYAKFTPINYSILYYDHNNDPLSLTPSAYTITNTPVALPTPDARDGFTFDGWCENSDRSDTPKMTIPEHSIPSGVYYKAFYAKWTENAPGPGPGPEPGEGEIEVSFVDANGDPMQQLCNVVTADTTTFTNGGWYVVNADVERSGTIVVEGSANLVLVDGKTLTVTGGSSSAGISVTNGCSLTIYGQSNGTGAIDATGGSFGAGIGGNCGSNSDHTVGACGTIVINGGTITANGTNAAGIGGGTYGNGGTVTINRGTVDADGGNNSAGIGGGQYGSTGGTVTINGGAVHAEGGGNSAGIGGGARCSGAVVTINGGNVRADSGVNAGAGIGSGRTWGDVVVSNGSLRVAATMTVYASTNLFETAYTAEHIREVDSSRFLEVENDWHSFLIEESVATVSQIHYYDGYSPVELEPSSYEEGTATPLATPSKNGFTFEGWCDNNALTGDAIKTLPASATGEQYFYAKWTPIVYSITYYLKGVPVELEPSTYTATNALTMLPEHPNGYYVSWYTNDQFTGEKQLAISYGSYGNKEFWAKISSAIGYKAEFYDGETLLTKPSSIFFDVESDTIVLPRTAYKDGYRFIDWYDNVGLDGDPVTTIPAGSISNKQFYAKWEATTDPVFTVDSEGNLIHFALNSATEITIPNNVYNIDSLLCYGGDYSAMTSLVIPGTVTNIGDSAFSSCTGLTNLTIEAGVKTIGDSAFFGCTALTCGEDGLYIPDSVTSIGNNAFVSTGLTKVSLPGAMYSVENDIHRGFGTDIVSGVIYRTTDTVFYISDGLLWAVDPKANTDITIPARVDRIGAGALHEITTVQSVQLHSGITNIAVAAFSGCTGLQSIDIPGSVECIGNGSFDYCTSLTNVTIGSGVKLIDTGAFLGCTALASVAIPGSVECISEMAFWDCTGLSSLTIEYGVKTIEEFAFCGCSSLVNVTLPKGLEIERYAFVDCTSLKSVNIGGSARVPNSRGRLKLKALKAASENPDAITVGEYAFIGCRSMESATIGSTVEDIGGGAFGGCSKLAITIEANDNYSCENGILYENDGKTIISAFGSETSLVVPSGVTNILDGAFTGYSTLTSVVLPSGVETIGEAAFSNATAFATITIPSSVTAIGANAFCNTSLATVNVSAGDTLRVQGLVEGSGYTAPVDYVEPANMVEFTVEVPANTTVAVTTNGAEVAVADGKYTVAAGTEVTITYTANDGYVVTGGIQNVTVDSETGTISAPVGMSVVEGVAKVNDTWYATVADGIAAAKAASNPTMVIKVGADFTPETLGQDIGFYRLTFEATTEDPITIKLTDGANSLKPYRLTFPANATLEAVTYSYTDVQGNGVLEIPAGVTFTYVPYALNVSKVIGEGTLKLNGVSSMPAIGSLLQNSDWKGTLEVANSTITTVWTPGSFGNANSSVKFNSVTTYLNQATSTLRGIALEGEGLTVNGTYSDAATGWEFAAALSGTGALVIDANAGNAASVKSVKFTGDASGFAGSVSFGENAAKVAVVFGANGYESSDVAAYRIVIGDNVVATVAEGKTWSANDFMVHGNLTLNGSLVDRDATGEDTTGVVWNNHEGTVLTVNNSAACRLGNATSWRGTYVVGWQPSDAFNPNTYGNVNTTVALANGLSSDGYFGAGASTLTINPAIRLDADVTIKNGYAMDDASRLVTFTKLTGSHKLTTFATGSAKKVYYAIGTLDKFTGSLAVSAKSEIAIGIVNVATAPADGACVMPATVGENGAINGDLKLYVNGIDSGKTLEFRDNGLYVKATADWPEDTSTVAAQTAAEAFDITGALTNVNAKALADWAKGVGNVDFADRGDIIPEAFLLNCANTAAAVEEATEVAEEAIAITAITIDENGVPQLTYPAEYGNGQVVVQGSATLGGQDSWHDGKQPGDFFFRTVLRLK